jgi:hypothetical protein
MNRPQEDAHAISSTDSPWTAVILFAFMSLMLVAIVVLGIVGEGAFTSDRTSQAQEKPAVEAGSPSAGNAKPDSLLTGGSKP